MKRSLRFFVAVGCLLPASFSYAQTASETGFRVVSVRKIWDAAPHNAFTDLERYQRNWICAFREGDRHYGPGDHGKIRVIASPDGSEWKSLALLESPGLDLRDAKLSTTPQGKLLLNSVEADVDDTSDAVKKHRSVTFFSHDGSDWEGPIRIADDDYWLWQTTWQGDTGYSLAYHTGGQDSTRLYSTHDGRTYELLLDHPRPPGDRSNEHALVFSNDDKAYLLLRRDGRDRQSTATHAMFGIATAPYTDWEWRRLSESMGGPAMIQLPDGRLLTCVRRYPDQDHPSTRVELGLVDAVTADYTPVLTLLSGGDTSYAGLAWHDDRLWVSYYSSHEGKASIYFAEVQVTDSAH